jgi:hypothetical protein
VLFGHSISGKRKKTSTLISFVFAKWTGLTYFPSAACFSRPSNMWLVTSKPILGRLDGRSSIYLIMTSLAINFFSVGNFNGSREYLVKKIYIKNCNNEFYQKNYLHNSSLFRFYFPVSVFSTFGGDRKWSKAYSCIERSLSSVPPLEAMECSRLSWWASSVNTEKAQNVIGRFRQCWQDILFRQESATLCSSFTST